jgi:hypothetical protein
MRAILTAAILTLALAPASTNAGEAKPSFADRVREVARIATAAAENLALASADSEDGWKQRVLRAQHAHVQTVWPEATILPATASLTR